MVEIPTTNSLEILTVFTDYADERYNISKIARKIKRSHVTLLPHLDELEKNQILKSLLNGRNKEFTINKESILTRNFIEMTENYKVFKLLKKETLLKKIVQEICNKKTNAIIIIFGSYVKGGYNKESDIDIAYIGSESEDRNRIFKEISQVYGKEINVKYISEKGICNREDNLVAEIIKDHIIINNVSKFVGLVW